MRLGESMVRLHDSDRSGSGVEPAATEPMPTFSLPRNHRAPKAIQQLAIDLAHSARVENKSSQIESFLEVVRLTTPLSEQELLSIADVRNELVPFDAMISVGQDLVAQIRSSLRAILDALEVAVPEALAEIRTMTADAHRRIFEAGAKRRRIKEREARPPVDHLAVLAERVAQLRKEKGLTQAELSDLSGITQSHISAIERKAWDPKLKTLMSLARALGVPPGELLPGGADEEASPSS